MPVGLLVEYETTQFGASGAAVIGQLAVGGFDGFLVDDVSKGLFMADTDGQFGWACAGILEFMQGFFNPAILAAMERDDCQATAGAHPFGDVAEESVDGIEFVIDGDANGLEYARCGMRGSGFWSSEYRAADVGELGCRQHLSGLCAFCDALCQFV